MASPASPAMSPLSAAFRGLSPLPLMPQASGSALRRDGDASPRPFSAESLDLGSPLEMGEEPLLERDFLKAAKKYLDKVELAFRCHKGFGLTDISTYNEFMEINPNKEASKKVYALLTKCSEDAAYKGKYADYYKLNKLAEKVATLSKVVATERYNQEIAANELTQSKALLKALRRKLGAHEEKAADGNTYKGEFTMNGMELRIELLEDRIPELEVDLETSMQAEKKAYRKIEKTAEQFKSLLGDRI